VKYIKYNFEKRLVVTLSITIIKRSSSSKYGTYVEGHIPVYNFIGLFIFINLKKKYFSLTRFVSLIFCIRKDGW